MKWVNLKSMLCPKPACGGSLVKQGEFYDCGKCAFSVGVIRFDQLISELYKGPKPRVPDVEENLAGLNNLGSEPRSEGFLDDDEVPEEDNFE